jgi:hypothetical protein
MSCSFFRIDTTGDAIGSSRRRVPEARDTAKKENLKAKTSYKYRVKIIFRDGAEGSLSPLVEVDF